MDKWIKYVYFWIVKRGYLAEEMATYFSTKTGPWEIRLTPWPRIELYKGQEEMSLQKSIKMRHSDILKKNS